jgi:hypothetical protein
MVPSSERPIRDDGEIIGFLSLFERITKTLDLWSEALPDQFAELSVIVFRIMFAVRTIILWQGRVGNTHSCANGAEVARQILEANDVIDVAERVRLAAIQPQIACDRHRFYDESFKFLPVPGSRERCGPEIIRDHAVPWISDARELVKIAEPRFTQRRAIFGER